MEVVEDVVIVGAGISGLTTSLGLHRPGIRSLVLESFDSLRITGYGLSIWKNAWRALDAIGVGDYLRQQHVALLGGEYDVRCVKRNLLLAALASELPSGTIRFSSKLVSIEESGYLKLVHLADGTILKAKISIPIIAYAEKPESYMHLVTEISTSYNVNTVNRFWLGVME